MRRSVAVVVAMSLLTIGATLRAKEAPVTMTDAQVEAAVRKAPPRPKKLDLDLKLTLIDYIDCTDPDDPHDFKDQGTSQVVRGPAGTYRITAGHRHAFFSYRFRAAAKDQPVLIVFEYPDDADRTINFSTHESGLSGRANADWSLETGVYTGEPFPLSGKMQYHTFIMYAQDKWPCVLVGNFHRYGHPAAASRIWIYRIDGGLPKLAVEAPEAGNQRMLGHFNSIYFLPTRFHFGLRSKNAIAHMLDYCEYVGVNLLSWGVVTNDSWGFSCIIPSWKSDNKNDHLDKVLEAMDQRENMNFIAAFYQAKTFKIGGKAIGTMGREELLAVMTKGFDEFIDRYGKYKSLKGITLGCQYGVESLNVLMDKGVAKALVKHIKERRPDWLVATYVGGPHLHGEYFDGAMGQAKAGDVVTRWESSGLGWSDFLGNEALSAWRVFKHDPHKIRQIPGLDMFEQYQPDDVRIFDNYGTRQQPRSLMYHDLDNSAMRSQHINTPYAAFWNTHYEGWYGLNPDVNFWYKKHWVAPDFNAPPPLSLFSFARAMGHGDRQIMMPGSWNNEFFGYEATARRMAKAFRALPPVTLKDVMGVPIDSVKARWILYKGKRYISLVNRTPFGLTLTVDGKAVALTPYDIKTLVDAKTREPEIAGQQNEAYRQWVIGRIARYKKLYVEVKALNAKAAPAVYMTVATNAEQQVRENRLWAAEITVGAGLIGELQLRKDILNPPQMKATRIGKAPPMNGDLDAWPEAATDILAEGGQFLAAHTYFPNSWSGPDDLSARLRFANDGEKLYVGIEVRDSVVARYKDKWNRNKKEFERADSCSIRLSTDGAYLDWISPANVKNDITWPISVPLDGNDTRGKGRGGFTYTCRRTARGYVVEGSASLSELKLTPGGSMGFLLNVSDVDKEPNIKGASWAVKQVLLYPHKPNYTYWSDARNCGRLVIEK